MADNTTLAAATGGDTVRDLARQSGTVKTQVVQLDLGGPTGNAEVLITAGPAAAATSVPVTPANNAVGAAAFANTATTVSTSAVSICASRTGVAGTGRVAATVTNYGSTVIYIGGSGVTTTTGYPIYPGGSITLNTTAQIYAIGSAVAAANNVAVLETY